MKKTVVVIDADSIAYAAGYLESPDVVVKAIDNKMTQILDDTEADTYRAYIEDWTKPKNIFRKDLFKLSNDQVKHEGYKGNRKKQDPPPYLDLAREILRDSWNVKPVVGYESEDYVITRARKEQDKGNKVYIAAIDKDLLHHPFDFYNYNKRDFRRVTPKQAALNLWRQVLTGDSTDNIPGIQGIGPAKAKKILPDDCKLPDLHAALFYKSKGLKAEYMIEQYNLIFIRDKLTKKTLVPDVLTRWKELEKIYEKMFAHKWESPL